MDPTTETTAEQVEVVADKKAVRELKIKAGSLKRNVKDYHYYKKDMEGQKEKVEAMIAAGTEESDIAKYKGGLEETTAVFATCKPRIEEALSTLENLLGTYGEGQGLGPTTYAADSKQVLALKATPEWQDAEAQVADAKIVLDSIDA